MSYPQPFNMQIPYAEIPLIAAALLAYEVQILDSGKEVGFTMNLHIEAGSPAPKEVVQEFAAYARCFMEISELVAQLERVHPAQFRAARLVQEATAGPLADATNTAELMVRVGEFARDLGIGYADGLRLVLEAGLKVADRAIVITDQPGVQS